MGKALARFLGGTRRRIGPVAASFVVVVLCASTVSGATISRSYTWEHDGRVWIVSQQYSAETYLYLQSLSHADPYTLYAKYVNDPLDDTVISDLVGQLQRMAVSAGLNVWEKLNLVLSFVQTLPYAEEEDEYPRYPLETLIEARGDCEDFAILTAALLEEMGFGAVLLAYLEEGHMAVGIRVLPPDTTNAVMYEWNGDTYYYLETTSPGWQIGELPPEFASCPQIIATQATVSVR